MRKPKPDAAALFAAFQAQAPIEGTVTGRMTTKKPNFEEVPRRVAARGDNPQQIPKKMLKEAEKKYNPPPEIKDWGDDHMPSRVSVRRRVKDDMWVMIAVLPTSKAMSAYGITKAQADVTLAKGKCIIQPAEPTIGCRDKDIRLDPFPE